MNKQNILILDINPYGVLTDSVKWSTYLAEQREVTVVCFTQKDGTKASSKDVKLVQVPNLKNRKLKAILFYVVCLYRVLFFRGVILIVYFPLCEILKRLIPWKKYILDVRTLSVSDDELVRKAHNERIVVACRAYGNVTAISKGVAEQLGLPGIKILPLGSDTISSCQKKYDDGIRLIYVGLFTNRHIEDTIKGVIQYHENHPDVPVSYNVIGYGVNGEQDLFRSIIAKAEASSYIHLVGKVSHSELPSYFDNANVGFSYVPITPYYDHQPPTKTFEYCMSGIYCIGTATICNKELISADNGMLIMDNAESVKEALEHFWKIRNKIDFLSIKNSLASYTWRNIVCGTLSDIIDNVK